MKWPWTKKPTEADQVSLAFSDVEDAIEDLILKLDGTERRLCDRIADVKYLIEERTRRPRVRTTMRSKKK